MAIDPSATGYVPPRFRPPRPEEGKGAPQVQPPAVRPTATEQKGATNPDARRVQQYWRSAPPSSAMPQQTPAPSVQPALPVAPAPLVPVAPVVAAQPPAGAPPGATGQRHVPVRDPFHRKP